MKHLENDEILVKIINLLTTYLSIKKLDEKEKMDIFLEVFNIKEENLKRDDSHQKNQAQKKKIKSSFNIFEFLEKEGEENLRLALLAKEDGELREIIKTELLDVKKEMQFKSSKNHLMEIIFYGLKKRTNIGLATRTKNPGHLIPTKYRKKEAFKEKDANVENDKQEVTPQTERKEEGFAEHVEEQK